MSKLPHGMSLARTRSATFQSRYGQSYFLRYDSSLSTCSMVSTSISHTSWMCLNITDSASLRCQCLRMDVWLHSETPVQRCAEGTLAPLARLCCTCALNAGGYVRLNTCVRLNSLNCVSLCQVSRFFRFYHEGHFKIYNCCPEHPYPSEPFDGKNPFI